MRISDWSSDVCSSDLALREFGGFLLKIGKFLFQIGEAVLRRRVGFFRQRFPFDLELDDTPVERFNLLGLALHLHAEAARCLVHQVNGLVRQEAISDVARSEEHTSELQSLMRSSYA